MLRLPHLLVPPFTPRASLDVAVCLRLSGRIQTSLATVPSILEAIPTQDAAPAVRVYVFARPAVASRLRRRVRLKFADLKIYSAPSALPNQADALDVNPSAALSMLGSRCHRGELRSVRRALRSGRGTRPVRVRAGPTLRSSARTRARWRRFLSAPAHRGRTSISPRPTSPDAGMRMLQDQVAS